MKVTAGASHAGIEMRDAITAGGRVTAVRTSHGVIHPGAVVLATGLAPQLPELPAPAVPQRWVKGHLLATVPAPFRLRTALAALDGVASSMAAATGDVLARWIATGRRPEGVASFGLERFGG
jgi:glycine/D-amino acid oxidase-like deaminating enzyme